MAQQVTVWKADDGSIHETMESALRTDAYNAAYAVLTDLMDHDDGPAQILDIIHNNTEVFSAFIKADDDLYRITHPESLT